MRVRLDISREAQKLADRINGIEPQRGRPGAFCSQRAVFWLDGGPVCWKADARSYEEMLKKRAHRLVGVYTVGVKPEDIAADLAEFM